MSSLPISSSCRYQQEGNHTIFKTAKVCLVFLCPQKKIKLLNLSRQEFYWITYWTLLISSRSIQFGGYSIEISLIQGSTFLYNHENKPYTSFLFLFLKHLEGINWRVFVLGISWEQNQIMWLFKNVYMISELQSYSIKGSIWWRGGYFATN